MIRWLVLGGSRPYQWLLSLRLPPARRCWPSCSEYAAQAVQRYGVWQGGKLALRRLLRCHPFHPGGYDPVP